MGIDPRELREEPAHPVVESTECSRELPYWSDAHANAGGDVHHFVAREDATLVGHTVLNVDGESAGLYDMGVLPRARRRGYGQALQWRGFCGGGSTTTLWLTRDSLMRALADVGLRVEAVGFEEPEHENGPALALLARA